MSSKFTKKHYIIIADIIDSITYHIESIATSERNKIAELFAINFSKDNEKFDYQKFLNACDKTYSRKL